MTEFDADFVVPTTIAILASLLTLQLPAIAKARFVYLRWHNPLPGSRAFSKFAVEDARIDHRRLVKFVDPPNVSPEDENSLWYRLYRSVKDEKSVSQAQRAYLLYRDWLVLILFVWSASGIFIFTNLGIRSTLQYSAIMLLQIFLVRNAAAISGNRFVSTVLAIKSTE